jgi:hypothetical protein
VPLTPPNQFGQLQARFQIAYHFEFNPAEQLTQPQIALELEPWMQLADTIGEWISEHPMQTIGILAGATLVFALAASRN